MLPKLVLGGDLIADGSYRGTLEGHEGVRLASHGMRVTLLNIESVRGSAGNDTVTLSGTLNRDFGLVDLRGGADHLHLAQTLNTYLRLKGVETVTGDRFSHLVIDGKASFTTDGSVAISSREGDHANQKISFTGIARNSVIDLGGGNDEVSFGPGFQYAVNAQGELVVMKDGKSLTFDELDRSHGSLTVQIDGKAYTYDDLLSAGFVVQAVGSPAAV